MKRGLGRINRKQSLAPPATAGDVRWLDAHWLLVSCKACEAIVDVEALLDFVPRLKLALGVKQSSSSAIA
jgi:hypothetical protein